MSLNISFPICKVDRMIPKVVIRIEPNKIMFIMGLGPMNKRYGLLSAYNVPTTLLDDFVLLFLTLQSHN